MYRSTIDNAVTYTPDDLDLFRQSPFALWMERLTLENPDHGIPPDVPAGAAPDQGGSPNGLVETLRAEGKQVATIDPGLEEPERREVTLAAMLEGADFIANGQLAVGAFSASAQLLMRTSGYSDLGGFLYIPCEPEVGDSFHSGFRVAFIANLLHSIQGQLPPQMLIIRDGTDVVPLQTEDHILYYWSVLRRFEQAMNNFRKHRMPDPSESCHFGRWSDCASEVLKQRAQSEQARSEEELEENAGEAMEIPPLLVATGSAGAQEAVASGTGRAMDDASQAPAGIVRSPRAEIGPTLAEQARMLEPGSYRAGKGPGHTPNLARFPRLAPEQPEGQQFGQDEDAVEKALTAPAGVEAGVREVSRPPADATLENLEFIGSSGIEPPPETEPAEAEEDWSAPAASLRAGVPDEPLQLDEPGASEEVLHLDEPTQLDDALPLPEPGILDEAGCELDVPRFLPPDPSAKEQAPLADREDSVPRSLDVPLPADPSELVRPPVVDLDSAPSPVLAPVRSVRPKNWHTSEDATPADDGEAAIQDAGAAERSGTSRRPFDDRLHTSEEFEDQDD